MLESSLGLEAEMSFLFLTLCVTGRAAGQGLAFFVGQGSHGKSCVSLEGESRGATNRRCACLVVFSLALWLR